MSNVRQGRRPGFWGVLAAAMIVLAIGQLVGCGESGSVSETASPVPPRAEAGPEPALPGPGDTPPTLPQETPPVETGPAVPEIDTAELEPRVAELLRNTRQAIIDDPTSARAWYTFGSAADSHRLYEYVVPAYREAVALEPETFLYVYTLAVALESDPRGAAESVGRLTEASALDPDYSPVWLRLGDSLSRQGRNAEARDAYEKAIELDADQDRARRGLGQALLASGEIQDAIDVLQEMARRHPDDGPTAAVLAQAYRRLGDRQRAAEAATRAREHEDVLVYRDPVRARAMALGVSSYVCEERADRLVAEGKFGEAVRNLIIVVEVHPDDPQAHYKLGYAAHRAGRLKLARTHLAQAVGLDAEFANAHRDLAQVLISTQHFDEAVTSFRRYLELQPGDTRVLWPLAAALAQAGRVTEALEQFQLAADKAPPNPRGELNWGVALMQAGNTDEAMARFRKVLELDPENILAHCNMGLACERVGLNDLALEHYREAARIDPNSFGARRLAQIERGE
ncbi:MAG: tetratricopeptide repeat protein [Planctomycetota bacterium]|jgi:tetratricopeptide (TPR) repeat protein